MIVTFRSKAHADIMMFGDIAVHLLKLMPPVRDCLRTPLPVGEGQG